MTDLHEAKRVRHELEAIERLLGQIDLGRLMAVSSTLAEHEARLASIESHVRASLDPDLAPQVSRYPTTLSGSQNATQSQENARD